MNYIKTLFMFLILALPLIAGTYYVDPVNGNDNNNGTITLPFKTISKGITTIGNAGGTLFLRGGNYAMSASINMSYTGSAVNRINVWAYNNEIPVLNFSSQATGSDGVKISGSYYHLKQLEVKGSGHNGINISGHYNIIENCKIYSNRNTGLQIGSSSGTTYPSNNLILNSDAFLNYDPPIGGNADGFGFKWNVGPNNKYKGCRAYNNSDDGWDLWMAIDSVEIDSCFAYRNGVDSWGQTGFNGNGNGIKLGGSNVATPNYVHNCVSFDNAGNTGRGFDENNNLAGQTLYNCVGFRNTGNNFHFANTLVEGEHVIKNCISLNGNVNITSGIRTNNSWNGYTPTAADFISVDTSLASAPREADGSLPNNSFFRLVSNSQFVNAGTFVGLSFIGSAPDIGAFEYNPELPVELVAFNAAQNNNKIQLTWKTASENNNHGFEIYRSSDNINWLLAGFIKGNGNSNTTFTYTFNESGIFTGKYYYKLKQIDFNGSYKYSDIISITVNNSDYFLGQNYPNPFNPTTNIEYGITEKGNVNLTVYDIAGREIAVLVNQMQDAGYYTIKLNGSSLSNGIYFYKLSAGNYTAVRKLILLK